MSHRLRILAALLLVLPWLTCQGGKSCCAQAPEVAHLKQLVGDVSILMPDGQVITADPQHVRLVEGMVLITGPTGHATVVFIGNNQVEMGPNARLQLGKISGLTAEFGAILLQGEAKVSSKGDGTRLAVGTPFGITEVGARLTTFAISFANGYAVIAGAIEVVRGDGTRVAVSSGDTMNLGGMVIKMKPAAGEISLTPLTFSFTAKQAQYQGQGTQNWVPVLKSTAVRTGDQLRVQRGGHGVLDLGEQGKTELDGDSELRLVQAGRNAEHSVTEYALDHGHLQVQMQPPADKAAFMHQVNVAKSKLQVDPGTLRGRVDVQTNPAGSALVAVRHGRVAVGPSLFIEAGTEAEVQDGQLVGPARPLTDYKVDLRPAVSAVVYYSKKQIPAVKFSWGDPTDAYATLEVASDKEFTKVVAREQSKTGKMLLDDLEPGHYYWRIDGKKETLTSLRIDREPDHRCTSCDSKNIIDDTGEKTVVYFQQAVPTISLRWAPVPLAHHYVLRLFEDGNFDTPRMEQKIQKTGYTLASGQVAEGSYFWMVVAQDEANRELSSGRINNLRIIYDNATTAINVRSPTEGAMARRPSIASQGNVELGTRLFINGKHVEVDGGGRFNMQVNLNKGLNTLVYRGITPDGVERFVVRQVRRR